MNVNSSSSEGFLPARRTWERYGVTSMTLHRWIADEGMNFPPPVYIGRFRYWKISDLELWERKQANRKMEAA